MRAFLLGAAVIALAACGSNDGNDPTDPNDPVDPTDPTDPIDPPTPDESARDNDEVAAILAAHLRAEFPVQLLTAEISKGRYPDGFTPTGESGLEYTGVGTIGSLNFDFVYNCNHDSVPGDPFVPCDEGAHHSHFKLTLSGAQSMGAIQMNEINRVVEWEIRDLAVNKARSTSHSTPSVTAATITACSTRLRS